MTELVPGITGTSEPLETPQPEPTATEQPPTPSETTVSDPILEAILGRIASVDEYEGNLKILVHSDPGGRKTTFAGTAPNNLIVDVEKGHISLKARPDLVAPGVQLLPYKSFFQVESLIDRMGKNAPGLEKFEVLTIDSMSEMHKRGLQEITEREFAQGGRKTVYSAETDDQAENNEHIRRLVSSLRDLDRHIILTSHTRTIQNKDKSVKILPDFSERLGNVLMGIMDVVAYVEKFEEDGEIKTKWWFDSDGYVMAKNRIGLPRHMIDPDFNTIFQYWQKNNPNK